MQTTHADRLTPAHGIVATLRRGSVVALYRGEVVTWQRGGVPAGAGAAPGPGSRAGGVSWQAALASWAFWASWQAGEFSGRAGELWQRRKIFLEKHLTFPKLSLIIYT